MFGSKGEDSSRDRITTIIPDDVVVEGSIIAKHAVRVDGTVNGGVETQEGLIVGQKALICGDVKAANVLVSGEIRGGVDSPNGRVEISETGKVIGDIVTAKFIVDEDAVFEGSCRMTGRNDNREKAEKSPEKEQADDQPAVSEGASEDTTSDAAEEGSACDKEASEDNMDEKSEAADESGTDAVSADESGDTGDEKPADIGEEGSAGDQEEDPEDDDD